MTLMQWLPFSPICPIKKLFLLPFTTMLAMMPTVWEGVAVP